MKTEPNCHGVVSLSLLLEPDRQYPHGCRVTWILSFYTSKGFVIAPFLVNASQEVFISNRVRPGEDTRLLVSSKRSGRKLLPRRGWATLEFFDCLLDVYDRVETNERNHGCVTRVFTYR